MPLDVHSIVGRLINTFSFFPQRGYGIDQMNPHMSPDIIEMPIKRKYSTVVFLRHDCNVAVSQINVFPLFP